MIHFSPFGSYIIYVVFIYWYITLPIGLLLLWACLRRKNTRWVRWLAGAGAAALLFPFLVMLWEVITGAISGANEAREYKQKEKEHTIILTRPETIAGIALSAGDTVFYNTDFDMSDRPQARIADIGWIHLSKPARFFNLEVKRMEQNQYREWNIVLAHDQPVLGWPCTGNVVMITDSAFVSGTLATEYVVWGYPAPKGARLRYERDYGLLRIELSDSTLATLDEKTKRPVVE